MNFDCEDKRNQISVEKKIVLKVFKVKSTSYTSIYSIWNVLETCKQDLLASVSF